MKGFFFSLDSLAASSVLLALFVFVVSQPTEDPDPSGMYHLDAVHIGNFQSVTSWNASYNTSKTVNHYIMSKYFQGDTATARGVCSQYYDVDNGTSYGVFTSNNTRICGQLSASQEDSVLSETATVTPVRANRSIIGPVQLTMVIPD